MAATDRTPDHTLIETLAGRAADFSFFQLVRLLERYYRPAARVGGQGPASAELLRFRPDDSLGFPARDVTSLETIHAPGSESPRFRITTSFLGLYGSTSPLPSFYSEEILWTDPEDNRVRDFLDLFHHRLLSLFYRSWYKYHYQTEFEHEKDDRFTPRLFALIGLGSPALRQGAGLPDPRRFIHFSALFHQRPHSASALENLLYDYFDEIPVEIEQCTPHWIPIHEEQLSSLGRRNCRLGVDCAVGSSVLGRGGSFRIKIGPMDYERFLKFLPDQEDYRTLRSIVGLFISDRLEFDVLVRVRRWARPQLISKGPAQSFSRLGWNTRLFSQPSEQDKEETVVFSEAPMLTAQKGPGR
jgi:type VI secretion system protein ImpH